MLSIFMRKLACKFRIKTTDEETGSAYLQEQKNFMHCENYGKWTNTVFS
jgi:hypothetical protein